MFGFAIAVALTAPSASLAARRSAPFGRVAFHSLDFSPAALSLYRKSSARRSEIAILPQDNAILHLFTVTDSGRVVPSGYLPLGARYSCVRQSDLDGDGALDYVLLDSEQPSMAIGRRRNGRLELTRYPVAFGIPRGVDVTDITGDGRPDVLVFGKSMTGIAVFAGKGRGEFHAGALLLPDLSVGDVRACDVDGDGVKDIVATDWLSNCVLFFRGMDGTQFSDPMSVSTAGEPGMIAARTSRSGTADRFAVTIVDRKEIVLLARDASGNFENVGTIRTSDVPTSVSLQDLNGDGADDVVCATGNAIEVLNATPGSDGAPLATYGVMTAQGSWQLGDLDGDSYPDLVAADAVNRRIIVTANARSRSAAAWPMTFLTASRPAGITLIDADRNGLLDLLIANEGSAAVSLHANVSGKGFGESALLRVAAAPRQIAGVPATGSGALSIVVAHTATDRLSVVSVSRSFEIASVVEIPTCAAPELSHVYRDRPTGLLGIVASCSEAGAGAAVVSAFGEHSPGLFLERKLPIPDRATVAGVVHFPGSGVPATRLLIGRTTGGTTTLSAVDIAVGDVRDLAVLPFRLSVAGVGDVDRDKNPDVIVAGAIPGTDAGVLMGLSDGGLKDSILSLPALRAKGGHVTVTDVNGDRCSDVVALDSRSGDVTVVYGNPRRTFTAATVCNVPPNAALAVGQLGGSSLKDLAILNPAMNTVTIILDPFTK